MSAKIFARSWVLAFDRIQVPGDIVMDTDRSQNKGSLDELAARLAARYEQELQALQALKAAACQQEGTAPVPDRAPAEPKKTSPYSDEETDVQMRARAEGEDASGAASAVENKRLLLAQGAAIWLAIGALTWLFAEPQIYATPWRFVVNLLIRPQLAAMAGVVMLYAVWLSLDVIMNPCRDEATGVISAGCACGLAHLCGMLLPFPGMDEVLGGGVLGLFLALVMLAPVLIVLLLIFPIGAVIVAAPIQLLHYILDRVFANDADK